MDYKFSGAGTIPGGEYEKIAVSGSARLGGEIRCSSFHSAGALSGEGSISCSGEVHTSGSSHVGGSISADSLVASGSFRSGSISGGRVKISGACRVNGDIEADRVVFRGSISCSGLINADVVEIHINGTCQVGSIGGGEILIAPETENAKRSIFKRGEYLMMVVEEGIEADEVRIENVKCPVVTGRCVLIGDGCHVNIVQYSDSVEISPNAHVGSCTRLAADGEDD